MWMVYWIVFVKKKISILMACAQTCLVFTRRKEALTVHHLFDFSSYQCLCSEHVMSDPPPSVRDLLILILDYMKVQPDQFPYRFPAMRTPGSSVSLNSTCQKVRPASSQVQKQHQVSLEIIEHLLLLRKITVVFDIMRLKGNFKLAHLEIWSGSFAWLEAVVPDELED